MREKKILFHLHQTTAKRRPYGRFSGFWKIGVEKVANDLNATKKDVSWKWLAEK